MIEFWEFFVFSTHGFIIRHDICNFFLPICKVFVFILFTVYTKEQIYVNFMKPNLLLFLFCTVNFFVVSKESLLNPKPKRLTPMYSFRMYIVLGFIFRSTIYSWVTFDIICMNLIKWLQIKIVCIWIFKLLKNNLLEKIMPLLWIASSVLLNSINYVFAGYVWTWFSSIDLFVNHHANTTVSWLP